MGRRDEVIDYLMKTDLLKRCCECQFKKLGNMTFFDDFYQDMWEWVMTYNEDKLWDAYKNHHLNALITRCIQNNIFSANSPYYKKYVKYYRFNSELIYDNNEEYDDGWE